ncbi:MAG TPA: COX15/CtaA family protein [Lacipirellulaceae bacterium]|jgi:cytochrome c oxidase assembly protein subunit 15
MIASSLQLDRSHWPHRLALVLACATFPLLWVGGLVTTTDAGMAVPDWPSTYGYNLFLYPWQSWLAGPWDLFVEHGHRLLASAVGMLTIALVVVLWRSEPRAWVRKVGIVALALVLLQGLLGGMRVLLDERTLAMLHGCTGPLFFAVTVSLAVFTSKSWLTNDIPLVSPQSGQVRRLVVVTAVLFYLQLVFGAVLRHMPIESQPATFALAVRFHLLLAGVLVLHVALLAWLVVRHFRQIRPMLRLTLSLVGLLALQLLLGASTWIVKFSVPTWAADWFPGNEFANTAGGWLQTHIITGHVAVGSLLLGTSVATALLALRRLASSAPQYSGAASTIGATT